MVEMREENRVFYEAQKGVSIGSGRWIEGARVGQRMEVQCGTMEVAMQFRLK